jgi:DNA-binding FadR family transcriptional regulator
MEEEFFRVQAATHIACLRITDTHRSALRDSADRASCLAPRRGRGRKAAAYAEIFDLLAEAAGDPGARRALAGTARFMHGVMLAAGPGADGMIASSLRRPVACLLAGDAEGAALEMEKHLRDLHFMSRLVCQGPGPAVRRDDPRRDS